MASITNHGLENSLKNAYPIGPHHGDRSILLSSGQEVTMTQLIHQATKAPPSIPLFETIHGLLITDCDQTKSPHHTLFQWVIKKKCNRHQTLSQYVTQYQNVIGTPLAQNILWANRVDLYAKHGKMLYSEVIKRLQTLAKCRDIEVFARFMDIYSQDKYIVPVLFDGVRFQKFEQKEQLLKNLVTWMNSMIRGTSGDVDRMGRVLLLAYQEMEHEDPLIEGTYNAKGATIELVIHNR